MKRIAKRMTCAVTGHRPKKLPWKWDESSEGCVRLKETLTAQILQLVNTGVTDLLTGMAEGVDVYCAEIVLAQREKNPALKLHCILPCVGQADKWTASAQKRYQSILRQADSIVFVNREQCKNCMLKRDRFLVEHASVLLAVYNGEKRGGTAATIRYAKEKGLDIFVIDPLSCAVSHVVTE